MASSAKRRTKELKASSKKKRKLSAEEEDGPALFSSKYAEPPTSKIYNSHIRSSHPAELFRKDLISAMKMPDSEPLLAEDYLEIDDPWKAEWDRGVQVPVDPDALPEPNIRVLRKRNKSGHFKLPKKLIRFTCNKSFNPDIHVMSHTNTLAERTCRYDMDDVDFHWLQKVNQDREDFGLQPLDELAMEQVMEELEAQAYVNFQEAIKSEEGLGIEYDEDAICDVCRSPDSQEGNEMVFCDSCNICVHQICYGILKIPEGSWICRTCALGIRPACVLCPNRGGAMKTTRCGQKWAHVGCAVWIPEVSFFNFTKMEPIIKISLIAPSRWALVCSLCNKKEGACIQCHEKSCKTAFHVTCAFQEGLQMRVSVKDLYSDGDIMKAFCPKHSTKHCASSDSEEDHRQLTSEERANIRQQKIQEKEAEFYNYVSVDDVAEVFQHTLDKTDIELVYNFWKLKRKTNWNRSLLPPKIDTDANCSEENSPLIFLKKLVHHRQDLERARNLCYMVKKREQLIRQWYESKLDIFMKQAEILERGSKKLSKEEIDAVVNANYGSLAYDKTYAGMNVPSPNMVTVLNNLVGKGYTKIQLNGIVKSAKKKESSKSEKMPNPYAKHYLNGVLKRSQRFFATVDKQQKSLPVPNNVLHHDDKSNSHISFEDSFELSKDLEVSDHSLISSHLDIKNESLSACDGPFSTSNTYQNMGEHGENSNASLTNYCDQNDGSPCSKFVPSFPDFSLSSMSEKPSSVDNSKMKHLKEENNEACIEKEIKSENLENTFRGLNNESEDVLDSTVKQDPESTSVHSEMDSKSELDRQESKTTEKEPEKEKTEESPHLGLEENGQPYAADKSAVEMPDAVESFNDTYDVKLDEIEISTITMDTEVFDSSKLCDKPPQIIPEVGTLDSIEEQLEKMHKEDTITHLAASCKEVKVVIPVERAIEKLSERLLTKNHDKSVNSIKARPSITCNKEKSVNSQRPFSNKISPARTQSPPSLKIVENGKFHKPSPKHNSLDKPSSKPHSTSKHKQLTSSSQASLSVNKVQPSSPSSKCQDSDSSEVPAPMPRKDMLRGYKIPKKPKSDKPEENSLDLKRRNSPLSPLPDMTTSPFGGYQPKAKATCSWRKLEPRAVQQRPFNGNLESQSERLVIKLKKDPSDSQRWKADPYVRGRGWAARHPPYPPPQWSRMGNHYNRSVHTGYGPGPPYT